MNPHFKDGILGRIAKDRPYSINLLESVEAVYRVGATLDAFKQKFAEDRFLSEPGRRAATGEKVRTELARAYATASRSIRTSRRAIANRRAEFDVAPIDKSDMVGEMRRREVRDYLRGLPLEKRPGAALALAADETLGRALLDAPAEMCGLGDELVNVHQTVVKKYRTEYVEKHFGEKLRELNTADDDYQIADQMVAAVKTELFEASGLTREGFENLIKPIEDSADRA